MNAVRYQQDFFQRGNRGRRECESRLRPILDNLPESPLKALDVGCDRGFFSFALSERVKSVDAFDPVQSSISECREKARVNNVTNVVFTTDTLGTFLSVRRPVYDVVWR